MAFSSSSGSGLRVWVAAALAASAIGSSAAPAQAFCRESTASQPTGPCIEKPGVPLLHWTRACMTYTFNELMFARLPRLTETEVREIFNGAFETWAEVDCGGRIPFFVEQAAGTTDTNAAEFVYDAPNESVIVARTRGEWASLPNHDPIALAFTLLWHDTRSGEILDVDMELNTGAGTFSNCSRGCSGNMVDLANTITHEAGHVLGLGHTTVRGATMTTTAIGAETEKRTLEQDDRDGYCSLDLPEFECTGSQCRCDPPPIYPSRRTVKTCGCRTPGQAGAGGAPGFGWLGAFAVAGLWLRRRARRAAKTRRSARPAS